MNTITANHRTMRTLLALVVVGLLSSVLVVESQATEQQMMPVLREDKMFMFGTASSNSVTPLVLGMLNRQFFEQTKAASPKEKDERNTGTIKLNLLVREVLYDTPYGSEILKTEDKQALANKILLEYLERNFPGFVGDFKAKGSLNVDQVTAVSDKIKGEILFRVNNPTELRGHGGKLRAAEMKASGEMAQMRRPQRSTSTATLARVSSPGLGRSKSSADIAQNPGKSGGKIPGKK